VNEHLSQEEIDTLLKGVDSGEVSTKSDRLLASGEVIPYELGSQDLTHGSHMPAMDMVSERFARSFEKNISNMLGRSVEVSVEGIKLQKFIDFSCNLKSPANLNLININPLHGTGLFVIEPELVLTTVDNFFGGDGRYQVNMEDREFTPTENRVIQLLVDMSFTDLANAWEPLINLDFVYLRSETDPQFASIVSSDEVVVVTTFSVELDGGNGTLHVVMPNSMLDPIKELDRSSTGAEQNGIDEEWIRALKDGMKQAVVEIDCSMAHTKLALSDVLKLNPGDVIPVDLPELVMVRAMKTPIFRGAIGVSNGKNAVQFAMPIERPDYSHD
jgi:flagellar motor switch protein FliM